MRFADFSARLLGLAKALHRWADTLAGLDGDRRRKVAVYADQIAATLARTVDALLRLQTDTGDAEAARKALREFGRISGYVETIVETLNDHLDGRKLAGIKRRLEQLETTGLRVGLADGTTGPRIDRIITAEGYMRALADALRT